MFPKRILIIEDSPTDAELMSRQLKKGGAEHIVIADNEDDLQQELKNEFELVISDYNLPGFSGLSSLRWAREIDPTIAFIICSGAVGDEKAAEVIKAGADDFISKDNIRDRLNISAERAFESARMRINAAEARRELTLASDRMSTILQNIQESILLLNVLDSQFRIRQINQQFIDLLEEFNPKASRLRPNTKMDLMLLLKTILNPPSALFEHIKYELNRSLSEHEPIHFRESLFTESGERKILEISCIAIYSTQVLVIIRDITRYVETEEHILSVTLQAQEKERRRLSYELHDSIGQSLSAAVLGMNKIISDEEGISSSGLDKLKNALQYTNTAIQEARALAHNLIPKTVEESGVDAAIGTLLDSISLMSEIDFNFNSNLQGKRFEKSIELNLFRICQEAINNIIRHSEASEASIQLLYYGEVLILTIDDNGKGFISDNMKQDAGIGVGGMLSRTRSVGGEFEISSHEGKGTHILIEIPLNPKS